MPETGERAAHGLWQLWQNGRSPELVVFLAGTGPLEPADLVAVLRVDQRQRWLAGQHMPAEQYLKEHPAVAKDEEAALDIIYAEYLLRQELGEEVSSEEFLQRFPHFAEQLRVQLHFGQALASTRRPILSQGEAADTPAVHSQEHRNGKNLDSFVQATIRDSGVRAFASAAVVAAATAPPTDAGGDAAMRVRCPHCHNPIHLIDNQSDEVLCPGCGSHFRVREARLTVSPAPMHLGKFLLLERVGLGAFGAVWKARDSELDRIVALKIPHTGLKISTDELRRFEEEARKVAQLRHPGIVTVYEVRKLNGLPAIVSDFIDGVTVRDLVEAQRPSFREAATLVADVAEALHYAHEKGLVHRDMKPANLMVEVDRRDKSQRDPDALGRPWILDFGLARWEKAEVVMTMDGQIIGTPAYMSPEQASGQGNHADRRSDIFSLGVILYELLCGELPFRGSYVMLLQQVRFEDPRPPRLVNDKIARDLQTICLTAMAKEPGRRYQTAADLAADLRRFLKGESIQARPAGRPERFWRWCRRHPRDAALIGTVAVLLALLPLITTPLAIVARRQEKEANEHLAKNHALMNVLAQEQQGAGKLCDQYGLFREAEDAYGRAIGLLEQLSAEHPEKHEYSYQLALRVKDLGDVIHKRDPASAEKQYQKALELLQPLAAAPSSPAAYGQGLARVWKSLGIVHHETFHYDQAEADFDRAIALLRRLTEDDAATPALREDLAQCYIPRGNLFWDLERLPAAEEAYTAAITLLQQVTKQSGTPDSRRELAMAFSNRASIRKKKVPRRDDEVEQDFHEALHYQEKLQAEFDKDSLYKHDLALIYNNLSLFLEATYRFAAAREENAKARAIAEELVSKYPTVAAYKSLLGVTLENRSWLLLDREAQISLSLTGTSGPQVLGELARLAVIRPALDEARRLLTEAIGLHQQTLKTNSRNAVYQGYLRSARKNLAETLLRQGDHVGGAEAAVRMAQTFSDEVVEDERQKADQLARSFLLRCAELAGKDVSLPEWRRRLLARDYLARADKPSRVEKR